MKYMKFMLPFIILFLSIGYAATNVTLTITGDLLVESDNEDFDVYISDVTLNGATDVSLLKDSLTLEYTLQVTDNQLNNVVGYEIANNSLSFDANLSIECEEKNVGNTNNISINNYFVEEENSYTHTNSYVVNSKESIKGLLMLTSTSLSSEIESSTITCTIIAEPIERNEYGIGEVPDALSPYYIGREIAIGTEKFNIISETEDTVTMLAQQNIDTSAPYNQTTVQKNKTFYSHNGWEYSPGPKEIDIQTWSTNPKNLVNGYVDYLKTEFNLNIISDLITMKQLEKLGCTIPEDYSQGTGGWTCNNSINKEWLVNNQKWWTKSAVASDMLCVWTMLADGSLASNYYDDYFGVRPVITVSKEDIEKLKKLITFTIEGNEYNAYEGMTWEEWVNSSFNTNENIDYIDGDVCIWTYDYGPEFDCISIESPDYFSSSYAKYVIPDERWYL